jgi:DNA-binding transcriptional ArsR family regulator
MDVFTAVADPTRRSILDVLAEGDSAAGRLVELFPTLSQPAVSRHLRVLLEVGLVTVRSESQRRIYALRPERLAELDSWLRPYQRLWQDRFDALERHLAQKNVPSKSKKTKHARTRKNH